MQNLTNEKPELVAISITTRNRSAMLDFCLTHFRKFNAFNSTILVVSDDNSSPEEAIKNKQICEKHNVFYIYNEQRLGIAKNKNKSIEYLSLFDYDYMFLFDDDCFPQKHNWDLPFIELYKKHKIEHSMYLVPLGELNVINKHEDYEVFDNCSGFCLFFTAKAMRHLKGMDSKFGIYGFEHAELSTRACRAGFTSAVGKYICPNTAKNYLFSYDMDFGWLKKESPLGKFEHAFTSSIEDERPLIDSYIEYNRKIFLNT